MNDLVSNVLLMFVAGALFPTAFLLLADLKVLRGIIVLFMSAILAFIAALNLLGYLP